MLSKLVIECLVGLFEVRESLLHFAAVGIKFDQRGQVRDLRPHVFHHSSVELEMDALLQIVDRFVDDFEQSVELLIVSSYYLDHLFLLFFVPV